MAATWDQVPALAVYLKGHLPGFDHGSGTVKTPSSPRGDLLSGPVNVSFVFLSPALSTIEAPTWHEIRIANQMIETSPPHEATSRPSGQSSRASTILGNWNHHSAGTNAISKPSVVFPAQRNGVLLGLQLSFWTRHYNNIGNRRYEDDNCYTWRQLVHTHSSGTDDKNLKEHKDTEFDTDVIFDSYQQLWLIYHKLYPGDDWLPFVQ
jgi:hypothetical protein